MLPYFRKYTIGVCVIAIALPIIASTLYPLFTGSLMAASLGGLIASFVLFITGFLIGFAIFERRAQTQVQDWINLYDVQCDPSAFIREGASVAANISFPCNESGAWYLGTYAQALLDAGKTEQAKEIYHGLLNSVSAAKKPAMKLGILVNVIPLAEKLEDAPQVLSLINEGLLLSTELSDPAAQTRREYLLSQQKIMNIRSGGNLQIRADVDEKVMGDSSYPLRIRVEYAWDGASCYYRLGNKQEEQRFLSFVVNYGNKLALVAQAKQLMGRFAQ